MSNIKFIMGDAMWVEEGATKPLTAEAIAYNALRKNWNTTTSIDDDGYPYPAITESNKNK